MTMTAESLSLWLIPEPVALFPLKSVIEGLADRFGGPVFTPHITLLSRIAGHELSACDRTEQLAERRAPIEINGARILWTREYFQAIILDIPLSPALSKLRSDAERLFPEHRSGLWKPHLSLAYGHIDATRSQEAVVTLNENVPKAFAVGALEVVLASRDLSVSAWRRIRTFPLGSSKAGKTL